MDIRTVGVVGSGLMGSGISQVAAQSGFNVILYDIDQKALDKGLSSIHSSLDRLVKKGIFTEPQKENILKKIKTIIDIKDLSSVDFLVEAATENAQVKLNLFKKLDQVCKKETILASNTSSIPITQLGAVTKKPEKVVGMHFMNPVPLMKLVEGIRGEKTSNETFKIAQDVAKKMGKTWISAKDSPAFVVNRILVPMLNEAVQALEEGLATKEDIDTAMKLGCNFPMGPFELLDYVGIDTALSIMEIMEKGFKDPKYRPSALLRKYVEAGHMGRKSGKGFYEYKK